MNTFELQSEAGSTEKQHSTSAYTGLREDDKEAVRAADALIFMRWTTPKLAHDERTVYAEDLAILCGEFHSIILRDAVAWHRQHTKRRPTVADLRERCEMLREQVRGRQQDTKVREMQEYERRIETHPDEFVPVQLIIRDTAAYVKERLKHFGHGEVDPVWRQQWWEWRNAATEQEWAAMRAKGVRSLRFREEERDRYGRPVRNAATLAPLGGAA